MRSAREIIPMTVRTSLYGLIIAGGLHALLPLFNATLPIRAPLYYATAAMMPNAMRLMAGVGLLWSLYPRSMQICPTRLTVNSSTVPIITISDWMIRRLPSRDDCFVLWIRYRGVQGRMRTMMIGFGADADLMEIDRGVRILARLKSLRHRRREFKRRDPRPVEFTFGLAPAMS